VVILALVHVLNAIKEDFMCSVRRNARDLWSVDMSASKIAQQNAHHVRECAGMNVSTANAKRHVVSPAHHVVKDAYGNVPIRNAPCCAPNYAIVTLAMNPAQRFYHVITRVLVSAEKSVLVCVAFATRRKS